MKTGTNNKFWKYTKVTTFLLMAFVIILSGCVGNGQKENESENATDFEWDFGDGYMIVRELLEQIVVMEPLEEITYTVLQR